MPILPRVSVGCTEFDTALKNINDAVKEADDKMYTAKKRARETADPLRKNWFKCRAPARAGSPPGRGRGGGTDRP